MHCVRKSSLLSSRFKNAIKDAVRDADAHCTWLCTLRGPAECRQGRDSKPLQEAGRGMFDTGLTSRDQTPVPLRRRYPRMS
eukprot:2104438-Prymnesium_polylepis.1